MVCKNEIDIFTLFKDLDIIIENLFKKEKVVSSFNELEELSSEKNSEEEDEKINDKGITIEEMVKSLNYCLTYLKMKEISTNENYFIYFCANIKILMDYLKQNKKEEKKYKKD